MKPALLSAFLLAGCATNPAQIAMRYEGKTGPELGLSSTLWCADLANKVRREAGLKPVPSRRAIDQLRYAKRITKPEPGALMITRRKGGHHVDWIVAVHADKLTVIGGNIKVSNFALSRVALRDVPIAGIFAKPIGG